MTITQPRQPAGRPAGGEFASTERTDAAVELAPETLPETLARRRGHKFYPASMKTWPALYATDDTKADEKTVVAKYFGPVGDWWIVEVDQANGEAFGYAQLAGMPDMGEWGYIDLPELEELTVGPFVGVERDLDFEPAKFGDIGPKRR